jgi:hypothetical protein
LSAIVFLYTTAGGIVGAAATQYVTHIRDRRSVRALVIENVGDLEAAYAALKITYSATDDNVEVDPLPSIEQYLARVEAAALIAGVPYTCLMIYIGCVRANYEARSLEAAADGFAVRVLKGMPKVLESGKYRPDEVKKSLEEAIELAKRIRDIAGDSRGERTRLSSLSLLKMAIWHPWAVQFVWRKHSSSVKSYVDTVNEARDMLAELNGRLQSKGSLTSHISRLLTEVNERSNCSNLEPEG